MTKRRSPLFRILIVSVVGLAISGCSGRPLALQGYDPVELVRGEVAEGDDRYEIVKGDFRYRFSSAENKATFSRDPEPYEIQLNGRCARVQGEIAGDPDIFTVHDGHIYIFSSSENLKAFTQDPEGYVGDHFITAESVPGREAVSGAAPSARGASDWPQWGGPGRNFTTQGDDLADVWPDDGPERLWERPLGDGFSAIAMKDGQLYTMYRRGDEDVAIAMDAATGRTVWEYSYEAPFSDGYQMRYGPGPHSTPLVVNQMVFTIGATGRLHAIDRGSGEPLWDRDLILELGGTARMRGYASSPLAHGENLILMVGGEGSAVVALSQEDGSPVWSRHDFANSPSSPIRIEVDGQEQIVAFMAKEIIGVDPINGDLLWSHPHETDWGLNISTPVWGDDNLLFVSSAYGGGSRVFRLTRDGSRTVPDQLWANRRIRLHFGNAIRIGDRVYGSSGDSGPSFFAAVDVHTGEVAWRQRGLAKASFLMADGRFIILDEDGVLALATPTSEGLEVHSKVQLLHHAAWTVPTLVGTTLYVRDRSDIIALDLR